MNLMDNACKFSENNTVNVDFSTNGYWIKLSFFNDDSAIPAKDLPNIFGTVLQKQRYRTIGKRSWSRVNNSTSNYPTA
jgi:K+-sensing histidine kinase KdpD